MFFNASVVVNSVDLSDHVEQLTLEANINKQVAAAMQDLQDYDMPGTLMLSDIAITFYQDYAAAKVYATLEAAWAARSTFNCVCKADAGANATTNPAWTIPVFILKMPVMMGKRGDRHMSACSLAPAGLYTIATS